jgi:hypothetical protein
MKIADFPGILRIRQAHDEAHSVAAFAASQRKCLVNAQDEERPKRGGTHPEFERYRAPDYLAALADLASNG